MRGALAFVRKNMHWMMIAAVLQLSAYGDKTEEISPYGQLLLIFIEESDKYEGRPLYEWLIHKARESGLAGATAIRGMIGFGANSRIHTAKILPLSMDLIINVEIADAPGKKAFLSYFESVITEGLVTLEKAEVQIYRGNHLKQKQKLFG